MADKRNILIVVIAARERGRLEAAAVGDVILPEKLVNGLD